MPNLHQWLSVSTPERSNPVRVPQQQTPHLRPSNSPGYQPQSVQPIHSQNSPVYISQSRAAAYGVAQRPVAQPLPPSYTYTQTPAPVQPIAQPPAPQQQISSYGPKPQPQPQPQSPSVFRDLMPDFWFKEGTPWAPCAYGSGQNGVPLPQYNNPRKKCIPWSPLCGWAFTCIQDV
ncbi:hypothetical protein M3Y97_00750900 [Aphelenchoides bicaudatus]|nr:hypothetical protein M3Y97_00750900 [Aphelenchoides bicaudatus]